MLRFEEALEGWRSRRLSQGEAALLLGVCERTLRRQIARYEHDGFDGLLDKRINHVSHRRAPVDEVVRLIELYRRDYSGWNVKHFYRWYQRDHGGDRSYSWVKKTLQAHGVVARAKGRGKHRKRRERAPLPGMLMHQDASTHRWVPEQYWDLVVTMDDATGEHLSMFFCHQEGPVERRSLTQVGRALAQLGIEHIAAYSPEARGRSERAFGTHQQRLPQELAKLGITDMASANDYLQQHYLARHNEEFSVAPTQPGSAFVPYAGTALPDILCEQFERTVGNDNCVSFQGLTLQIPPDDVRYHYAKSRVRMHRYVDDTLAVFYGPRCLAHYDAHGTWFTPLRLRPA